MRPNLIEARHQLFRVCPHRSQMQAYSTGSVALQSVLGCAESGMQKGNWGEYGKKRLEAILSQTSRMHLKLKSMLVEGCSTT